MLDSKEVATRLGFSRNMAYYLFKNQRIKYARKGTRYRVKDSEFRAYVKRIDDIIRAMEKVA